MIFVLIQEPATEGLHFWKPSQHRPQGQIEICMCHGMAFAVTLYTNSEACRCGRSSAAVSALMFCPESKISQLASRTDDRICRFYSTSRYDINCKVSILFVGQSRITQDERQRTGSVDDYCSHHSMRELDVTSLTEDQCSVHPFSFSLSMSFQVIVDVLGFLIVSSPRSLSCLTRNGLGVLSGDSPRFSRTVGHVVVPPS